MAFGTSFTSDADAPLIVREGNSPVLSVLDTLRQLLAGQGLCESVSSDEEGFYFVIEGRGEVSLQYHDVERNGSLTNAKSLRRHEAGLLKCCAELAEYGHALTLVMSPRTLALHIRFE